MSPLSLLQREEKDSLLESFSTYLIQKQSWDQVVYALVLSSAVTLEKVFNPT